MIGWLAMAALGLPAFGAAPARAAQDPGRTVRLVAFGDSLMAGYMLPQAAAFPVVMQAAPGATGLNVEVVNAGVSGDTTTGGLDRLDWSVPDGTDGVLLELGANDMLRGVDPEIARKNLDTIVVRLKARGIPVLLCGMYAAPNLGADYGDRFNRIFTDLARTHDLMLYPFFLDGVMGERRLQLADGLHPSAEGVRVIVERLRPMVETFVARLGR